MPSLSQTRLCLNWPKAQVGFSGKTREIPPTRKVSSISLGKLWQLEAVRIRDAGIQAQTQVPCQRG
jgi:hypothetical protein